MGYITETFLEYPDNSSIATIFYFSGCNRNCKGCQNTDLQEYDDTMPHISIIIKEIEDYCKRLKTNKIVLCGGDPLFIKNIDKTKQILENLGSNFDICIYTGATIQEVKKLNLKGFKFIKCGMFDENKFIGSEKTDKYLKFATSNQELYDSNLKLLSKNGIYYF